MSPTESVPPRSRKKKWVVCSVMVVPISLIVWLAIPISSSSKPNPTPTPVNPNAPDPNVAYRKLILGEWETYRDGKRLLNVSADGTAVMHVEIAGLVKQTFFGKQMRIDLAWSIENGNVNMECVGGEPGWAIKAFTTAYGTERSQPILNLDTQQLLLKDDADDPDHDYKRISQPSDLHASPSK